MSHLPPPPPNAVPYAPPSAHLGPSPYPTAYPPYANHVQYQPPPPAMKSFRGGDASAAYNFGISPPRAGGPSGPPKSRMQVTRYPRPPGHGPQPPPQYGPPPAYHQPPHAIAYQPPTWPPPPQLGYAAATSYPAPPQAPYQNVPPPAYPPPPQQSTYGSYAQQPHFYAAPPPPPHAAYHHQYRPPPNAHQPPPWAPPHSHHVPNPAWSPPPTVQQGPPAPPTPIGTSNSVSVPYRPPTAEPPLVKDREDPTFYDGWDDADFEWGGALWPKANEQIDERFSLGQYIWRPAEQVITAISSNLDEQFIVAEKDQHSDQRHCNFSASKYFKSMTNCEGDEYVYNFQRLRYTDEWEERKDDPIFTVFPLEADTQPVAVAQILTEVLKRDRDEKESRSQEDVMGSLEQALTSYMGAAGGPPTQTQRTGPSTQATVGASDNATESLLASLGVTGVAKPVRSTPFPAYNHPPEDPLFSRPHPPRTPSSSTRRPSRTTHPHAPPSHIKAPPSRVSPPLIREPHAEEWNDPWKAIQELTSNHSSMIIDGQSTPVGSDFGDVPAAESGSSEQTVKDERSVDADSKKRKMDEPDSVQRKRSKAKNVESAYQRRWL